MNDKASKPGGTADHSRVLRTIKIVLVLQAQFFDKISDFSSTFQRKWYVSGRTKCQVIICLVCFNFFFSFFGMGKPGNNGGQRQAEANANFGFRLQRKVNFIA